MFNLEDFKKKCTQLRLDTIEIARHAKRGHIGGSFSIIESLVTLYDYILKFDSKNTHWPERDRFILSKGHCCMSWYAILAQKDFITQKQLYEFCNFESILGGHPTKEKVPGCEASTGSLGHGLSIGVGFAVFAKLENKKFKTYILLGDGECNEGSIWEAALSASKHCLDNLVVLVDYNKFQSFGSTKKVCSLDPFAEKWKSFGFETFEIDMVKEPEKLYGVLSNLSKNNLPKAIICNTIKGQGVDFMEGNLDWHHKSKITPEEVNKIKEELEKKL